MAWPLGLGGRKRSESLDSDVEDDISIRRLEAMSNVGYEEVPLPDEGELSEEEAWTISPTSAAVRIGSQLIGEVGGKSSSVSSSIQTVEATVDTKALERLLSSRLDMVEDTMRSMSFQIQDAITKIPESSASSDDAEGDEGVEVDETDETIASDSVEGGESAATSFDLQSADRVITASGEVIKAPAGSTRMAADDAASLMELYEAQALALNPFLATPEGLEEVSRSVDVGSYTLAALLLDNMTGMAATSFLQKAIQSGMLTEDEYNAVVAIVHLAVSGDPESALEDKLPNRELLTFSALITAWRNKSQGSSSMEG